MIEIFINNLKYFFEKNITILQACEQANINIPRFCYHDKLSIAGNCRMCLVEIEKSPKPVASCAMPIASGMVIFTETPLVKKSREAVIEFLLLNHPLDCPICDQGGECDLQDITLNFGSDKSRYFNIKRGVEDKECGPIIKTIMTRCIHCTRCIRFLTEIVGIEKFGALGRGESMEIGTFLNKYLKTEFSGNLIDVCPVGALTSKPYAFLARNWELKKIESVDFTDGCGSNIIIHCRSNLSSQIVQKKIGYDKILRILPKSNNILNEMWISDKSRFFFDGNFLNRNIVIEKNTGLEIKSKKKKKASWNIELFNLFWKQCRAVILFNKKQRFIGCMGTVSSIEEVFFFLQFLKNSGYSNFLINNYIYKLNFDLPLFYQFNSKFIEIEYSDLILLIGCNIRTDSSLLNLKIRKQFFNKESLIGFFGSFFNALFPYIHLGTSTKQFFQLIEGRHFFCKKLRAAQKPLLICGAEFGFRNDSKSCQNVIKFLAKKLSSNLKNLNSLNILHQNLSQIHFCELGFNLQANNFLYNMELNKNFLFNLENNNLFFLNNIDFSSEIFPKLLKNKFCSLNSHNYEWISDTMQNFPIKTLFEKNSLIINTEGRIQKISQTITSINSTRDSTEFFISLLKLQQTKNKFKNFLKNLYIENPFLKNNFKTRSLFYFNFLNLYEISNKIIFSPLINSIHNFYMTDNISQNSKTMAECTLFLKIKKNFLK